MKPTRAWACLIAGALGLGPAACGSDDNDVDGPVAATAPRTGLVVRILAQDNLFRAGQTAARIGDTVRFENVGRNDHDVFGR